jgi:hypothetical protein
LTGIIGVVAGAVAALVSLPAIGYVVLPPQNRASRNG